MLTRNKIVADAKCFIGVKENPAGSNNVPFNTWYYGHEVNGSAYSWCMVFVDYIFNMANAEKYIYGGKKVASCTACLNYFKKTIPSAIHTDPSKAEAGDIVFFRTKKNTTKVQHVGIVSKPVSSTKLYSVEGNTSSGIVGSQDNGGCVAERLRSTKGSKIWIAYIVHIPYDDDPKPVSKYVVKKGDTLSKIAKVNNTTWQKLAEINNIKAPYVIRIGQELKLD